MIRFLNFAPFILFLFNLTSCQEDVVEKTSFYFRNNSTSLIFVNMGIAPRESGGCLYPDTGIHEIKARNNFV